MSYPSHPRFYRPSNTWRTVQTTKLIIMKFSSIILVLPFLWSNILVGTLLSNIHTPYHSQVSHLYKIPSVCTFHISSGYRIIIQSYEERDRISISTLSHFGFRRDEWLDPRSGCLRPTDRLMYSRRDLPWGRFVGGISSGRLGSWGNQSPSFITQRILFVLGC